MKWKKFTIQTTTAAEDFISEKLSEIGIEGIEIEDKVELTANDTKGMFIDVLPDLGPDDGEALVSFYLDDTYDVPKTLAAVKMALEEVASFVNAGSCEITASETEDKDWMNNWKQYFKPFVVDDLLIKPTWEEIPEGMEGKKLIQIDPGMAFGTGKHETTQLCIAGIRKYVKQGDNVLDVGTGSGILSICALLSGASHVVGTDLDENAIDAAHENAQVNGITSEQYKVLIGNLIDDQAIKDEVGYEAYDVVVANILADVIIALQEVVAVHVKHGGIFITSGIIDMKEQAVMDAFAKNPEFDDTTINTVKTALMGPLSAIGDTLFPATLRILATSLVITMAAAGNVFAPILFLLIYNIPNYLARWYSLKYGYSMGMEFMVKSQKSGIMDKVSYACTVVGLMAIGAMIFYTVNISTPITIGNVKNGGIVLQTTLDTVMPGMLKIALVGIEYWLLKKGVKVVPLLIGTMAVGVLLFAIGAIA